MKTYKIKCHYSKASGRANPKSRLIPAIFARFCSLYVLFLPLVWSSLSVIGNLRSFLSYSVFHGPFVGKVMQF